MEYPMGIRVGSVLVVKDGRRGFLFEDAFANQRQLLVSDLDVPELIRFLHHWSDAAKQELRLDSVGEVPQGPHAPSPSHPAVQASDTPPDAADRSGKT